MKKYVPIFDPGHGGVEFGQYKTGGKRSPKYDGSRILYEGEYNRAIIARVIEMCEQSQIPYAVTTMDARDMGLKARAARANELAKRAEELGYQAYVMSVHANAGGGRGLEVWTSPGQTESDHIATVWAEIAKTIFPNVPFREGLGDGDPDKEAKFTILMETEIPAILTENFFMDNKADLQEYLLCDDERELTALLHFITVVQLFKGGTVADKHLIA